MITLPSLLDSIPTVVYSQQLTTYVPRYDTGRGFNVPRFTQHPTTQQAADHQPESHPASSHHYPKTATSTPFTLRRGEPQPHQVPSWCRRRIVLVRGTSMQNVHVRQKLDVADFEDHMQRKTLRRFFEHAQGFLLFVWKGRDDALVGEACEWADVVRVPSTCIMCQYIYLSKTVSRGLARTWGTHEGSLRSSQDRIQSSWYILLDLSTSPPFGRNTRSAPSAFWARPGVLWRAHYKRDEKRPNRTLHLLAHE